MNVACYDKNQVVWNDATRTITNDPKANEPKKAHYRSPWQLPTR